MAIERCPQCHKLPRKWKEQPQYGSRELYIMGCREHGHMGQGVTSWIAEQNWKKVIHRWVFEQHDPPAEMRRLLG